MLRPEIYRQPCVAIRNVPYFCGSPEERDLSEGGVLCQGRTVWTTPRVSSSRKVDREAVFVDGLGVITVDPHWLTPADGMILRTAKALLD